MAIDEADQSDAGQFEGVEDTDPPDGSSEGGPTSDSDVRVGRYTWREFMEEHGYEGQVSDLYANVRQRQQARQEEELGLESSDEAPPPVPEGEDWGTVEFDPTEFLGFHPDDLADRIRDPLAPNAKLLHNEFLEYVDPDTTPVVKDVWTWEHFKWEYYYDENGDRPRAADGSIDRFDAEEFLGFDPAHTENELSRAEDVATELKDLVDERTVNVNEEIDEDAFFSTADGHTTVTNRYDLEKAVPFKKKRYFREKERYWVNKPYAFVIVFHSEKENEVKYYVVEPYLTEIEDGVREFLTGKLRNAIKYSDENLTIDDDEESRRSVIEQETRKLLKRYDLFDAPSSAGGSKGLVQQFREMLGESEPMAEFEGGLDGIEVRPEPIILEEDPDTLNEYQVEKLLYQLKRNFIGYERIDPIKHDINVEDISCDGYNSPVFVYHSEYEQIITNIYHGEDELDDFVVKMAQRSGKGISKRRPQVDATLPDGSRAQLTLGKEVSDHGTNYTIRQFQDVPHTPIDLINWNTFSLDEMAFLWLCIENHKSLIFAGGTASGKTTSLNAVSLFIPSTTKVVSIEDTREVELPQRNWIASVTRQSFTDDSGGGVDEFDLLEAALRQRPDYIVMGEVRGEEGRDLFQVMSTGHTSYSTFHADTVGEVLKRFTTDPINVSKTMFTALDLVSIQTQTRVGGHKVRRNKKLTEVNHYDAETDEINVQDVYQWQAETDEFLMMGDSNTLEEIKFDRGWNQEKLEGELFKRRVIIAYLIKNGLNEYTEVAATVQAFINDPDTIMTLVANGQLEESLEDLQEMESILLDVDPEKEELVPRPDPPDEIYNEATDILERAEESLFDEFRGQIPAGLASALSGVDQQAQAEVEEGDEEMDFGGAFEDEAAEGFDVEPGEEFGFSGATGEEEVADEGPDWLSDEGGFDFGEGDDSATADAASEAASAGATAAGTDAADAASGPESGPASGPSEAEETPPALEADASGATGAEPGDADGAEAETAPNGGTDTAGASSAVDDGPDQPELESGAPDAGAATDDDPIFSEPDDTADTDPFGGDDGGFFDDDDVFDEEGDDGGSIFSEGETVSSGGGGMFGTAEDKTGDDLLEEAGDLFGGDADDGDQPDDGTADASEESTADTGAPPVEEPSDPPAPSEGSGESDAVSESDDGGASASVDEAGPDSGADTGPTSESDGDTESPPDADLATDDTETGGGSEDAAADTDAQSEDADADDGPFDDGDATDGTAEGDSAGDAGIFGEEESADDGDDGGIFGDDAGDEEVAPDSDEEGSIFSDDADDEGDGDAADGIFGDDGGGDDEGDEDADDGIFGDDGGDGE